MSAGQLRDRWVPPSCLAAIFGVPTFVAFGPVFAAPPGLLRLTAVAAAPILWSVTMPLIAGLIARSTIGAIVAGSFDPESSDPSQRRRRLHDVCWTAISRCLPVYQVVLAIPWLKRATFRLFGYHGSLDVTVCADTSIAALPLLELGSGSYLSSRATVGMGICLRGAGILVAPVCIGRNTVVGHLAVLGPGVVLGDDVEIGVSAVIGPHAQIGGRSTVGPCATIQHGVRIGAGCHVGAASHVGAKATVADGLTIPFGTVIPPRMTVGTPRDVDELRLTATADATRSPSSVPGLTQLSLVSGSEG